MFKNKNSNVLFGMSYINEFIQIINCNNLDETFQAYKMNYSIVTRKESFFSCDSDHLDIISGPFSDTTEY